MRTESATPTRHRSSNVVAIAGFFVSLLGMALPYYAGFVYGLLSFGLIPVGLILSIIGLFKSRRVKSGRNWSIVSLTLLALFGIFVAIMSMGRSFEVPFPQ